MKFENRRAKVSNSRTKAEVQSCRINSQASFTPKERVPKQIRVQVCERLKVGCEEEVCTGKKETFTWHKEWKQERRFIGIHRQQERRCEGYCV
jgi:hypothetical protein